MDIKYLFVSFIKVLSNIILKISLFINKSVYKVGDIGDNLLGISGYLSWTYVHYAKFLMDICLLEIKYIYIIKVF